MKKTLKAMTELNLMGTSAANLPSEVHGPQNSNQLSSSWKAEVAKTLPMNSERAPWSICVLIGDSANKESSQCVKLGVECCNRALGLDCCK